MKNFLRFLCFVVLAICLSLLSFVSTFADEEIEFPLIAIKAVNPGYTVDGKSNTGELIELARLSDEPISLANLSINYTNSSGNRVELYTFPDGSEMVGGTLLLRLSSSPGASYSDAIYTNTLAMAAGPLELSYKGKVFDSVCWTGKNDCYEKFNSKSPTTLVRDFETDTFSHQADYVPIFNLDEVSLKLPEMKDEEIIPQCRGLQFSEIYSYYETAQSEQFVEIYNPTDDVVVLNGCNLRYKNKNYSLDGLINSEQYFVYYPRDFALTKNPTSSNKVELIDTTGEIVDSVTFYNGQRKGMSYAQFGFDDSGKEKWLQTYSITPGEANDFREYKTCEDGKVLNEATGNCVKASTVAATNTACPAGKYRNPLTGRCKSYASSSEPKECAEGYERNPETGRCRKVKNNNGAEYELEPESYSKSSTFIAIWAVLIIILAGLIYIIFQFRHEIANFFKDLKTLGLKKSWQKFIFQTKYHAKKTCKKCGNFIKSIPKLIKDKFRKSKKSP